MAWIKMKDAFGREFTVTKPVYDNYYKHSGYTLVQESKPAPLKKPKEDVVENEQVQKTISNEGSSTRKSTKKATV